jgi:predicted transcriptional regulator
LVQRTSAKDSELTDQTNDDGLELLEFTSDIVAAYVAHNALSSTDLPKLIADVHLALKTLGTEAAPAIDEPQKAAVSIRKSVTPDYLICLEDGKKFKSLKRHLLQLGMTPAQYREKWKLPPDYPMVAPNYSATRSALAKSLGLGRKPAAVPAPRKGRQAAATN